MKTTVRRALFLVPWLLFSLVPQDSWSDVVQADKMHWVDTTFAAPQAPERMEYLLFTAPNIGKVGILNLRVSGKAGRLYRLCFAVRRDWPILPRILGMGRDAVSEEEKRDINRRWIAAGEPGGYTGRAPWITFGVGFVLVALTVAIAILWNRTLRAVVRQRTSQLQQELAERRQIEEALRQSEERYRRIVDTAGEGICVLGADTRTTFVNSRMTRMLGCSPSEMIGRQLTEFMFEEDAPDHLLRMKARRKGASEIYERRFRCKGGGILWAQVSATPIIDEAGRFLGSFGMFTDITSRKEAEGDLLRLNRQLRAISTCNQVLMQATNEQTLLEDICTIICEEAGYRMAWVGYAQNDDPKSICPMAWAGVEEGYLAAVRITWDDTAHGSGPSGQAVRQGVSACIQDFAADPQAAPWREAALQRGYRSSTALPLKDENGTPFGALCIYSAQPDTFTSEEMKLLDELAGNLAFGITSLRIRAEHRKAEIKLLASEQLFRALVENSPDFIARYDREYRRTYFNPAIQRLFGNSADKALGKTPADQSPLYAPNIYIDHLRRVTETATESTAEIPFRTTEGEMHWGHLRFVPEFGPEGDVVSVLAIGRDIHEVKENEQRFRMLAENFPDFVMRFDRDGHSTFVNPAVEKAFTLPTGSHAGKTLQEIARHGKPEQNDALLKMIRDAFDKGTANESEMYWNTASGKHVFEIRNAPEKDAAGNVISVLSIARDITERKRIEEALSASEAELRTLIHAMTDVIFVGNSEGRYLKIPDTNPSLLYKPSEELLGKTLHEVFPRDQADFFLGHIRQALSAQQAVNFEYSMFIGKTEMWFDTTISPMSRDKFVMVARDISGRKKTEQELVLYRDHLEELVRERTAALKVVNEELEAFAYSVSHDLRAPLRHIDGFLELLEKRMLATLDEQGRHYMDNIADAARKMGHLVDNLLSFSRLGRQAMSCQQVDLADLVRDVIQELAVDVDNRNIEWLIGDLPVVGADAEMLQIALVNLIANALKFTRPRQQARIEIGSQVVPGSEAVIFVSDNGVGFDTVYAGKMFGVFQRLHHTEEFEGTGIGLATVSRIIDRHGGRIWADGKPGKGATFYFSLPDKLRVGEDEGS